MNTMNIGIFGAGGMLGSDLVKHGPAWARITGYHRDVDITNKKGVSDVLERDHPDWVINAVAYSNVDLAEVEKDKAFQVNCDGPRNIKDACAKLSIPFIHVSTDYVFAGDKDELYVETDAPHPLGQYGASKLCGEKAVQTYEKHYILRTTTLYGAGRANHVLRVLQALKDKKPMKAVKDLVCSPTYTGDLADWIYQLIQKTPSFGTYHLCHKGTCSRFTLAETICEKVGAKKPFPVEGGVLNDLNLPAPRPPKACLSTRKWESAVGELFSWDKGLAHYLSEIKATAEQWTI